MDIIPHPTNGPSGVCGPHDESGRLLAVLIRDERTPVHRTKCDKSDLPFSCT